MASRQFVVTAFAGQFIGLEWSTSEFHLPPDTD
jgi:hypothetical protein